MNQAIHFKGLNSLRFYAAFLVIIYHINRSLARFGFPAIHGFQLFEKGDEAVSFFFSLSGFLITYLLLNEHEKNRTINVKKFYMRRILRIWPLYFTIAIGGLAFYNLVLPKLGYPFPVEYSSGMAFFCYVFFLPNIMTAFFDVGGILSPLWSIGVEEQFYIIWAPIIKFFRKRIMLVLIIIAAIFITLRIVASYNPYGLDDKYVQLIYSLRFYYMAFGGMAAWLLFNVKEKVFHYKIFKSKKIQLLHFVLILLFLLFYNYQLAIYFHWIIIELIVIYLFIWLILNQAANPHNIILIENRITDWLGKISYGLYMYHMVAHTAVFFMYNYILSKNENTWLDSVIIFLSIVSISIFISWVSHKYFESRFLRIKQRFQIAHSHD